MNKGKERVREQKVCNRFWKTRKEKNQGDLEKGKKKKNIFKGEEKMKRELETVKENEKREITGRKRERVRMETESVQQESDGEQTEKEGECRRKRCKSIEEG